MPKRRPPGDVVSTGVDWITCTIKKRAGALDFVGYAHELLNAQLGEGHRQRLGKMQGYEIRAVEGLIVGERTEDYLVQLSGELAHREWGFFAEIADNVSRVDLEATAFLEEPDGDVANEAIRRCLDMQRHSPGRGRRPEVGRMTSYDMREKFTHAVRVGSTAYVGSPKSDFRVRVYDKSAELGWDDVGQLWRYELQARRQNARRLVKLLLDARARRDVVEEEKVSRRQVHTEVRKRGIVPRFRADQYAVPIDTARPPSDYETWRRWVLEMGPAILRRGVDDYGHTPDEIAALLAGKSALAPMTRGPDRVRRDED